MRNIDKCAQKELYAKVEKQAHSLRGNPYEYQVVTGLCPVNVIEMHAQKILALLDELDKWKQESSAWQAVAEKQLALATNAEQKISELESLTAQQLPQSAPVSVPEVVGWEDVPEEITEDDIALASAWAHGFNQCRAAMLHGSEPETDNTNQQFESLSRGDK